MYQTLKLLGFTNREATNCRSRPKYEKLLKEKYGSPPKKRSPRKSPEASVGNSATSECAGGPNQAPCLESGVGMRGDGIRSGGVAGCGGSSAVRLGELHRSDGHS